MRRNSPRIRSRRLVERAQRLVEQHELGLRDERAREGDALLLPARNLMHAAPLEPREADEFDHVLRSCARLGLGDAPLAIAQAEGDIVEYGEVGKQREILKHEADAAQVGRRFGGVASVEKNAALFGSLEAGDGAQQHGLAGTAGAEQRNILARVDAERDVSERDAVAETLRERIHSKDRGLRHRVAGSVRSMPPCARPVRVANIGRF
jgi:hypothetical protein